MAKISNEDLARLKASKAQHEGETGKVEETKLLSKKNRKAASHRAGIEWALKIATHRQLMDFAKNEIVAVRRSALGGTNEATLAGLGATGVPVGEYDVWEFQDGARSVLDQLRSKAE